MEYSKRMKSIPPYVFAAIDKKRQEMVAKGIDVINLGIGDPDEPTPAHIVQAMHKAIDNPQNHHYPPFGGMKEFKQAAAAFCQKRFGIDLDPGSEITSLIGTKEGLHNILMVYVDEGDVVLVPDPAYPVYQNSTILCGGKPHFMTLERERGYLPDLNAIPEAVAKKAKVMFINYPNNPTAGVCDLSFLESCVHFARKNDILLVSDLAYSEMTFDGYKAHSIFEIPGAKDVAIELQTLSKAFNMTGWRIGYAIGNKQAVNGLATLKSNIDTDIFKAIQIAGIAGLTGPMDHIAHCNNLYVGRRDLAIKNLRKLGWEIEPNKATFYMWLPTPKGVSSREFCTDMLEKCHIVVPPGTAYGPSGEGYFRLSLCCSEARLQEAFDRMAKEAMTFAGQAAKV